MENRILIVVVRGEVVAVHYEGIAPAIVYSDAPEPAPPPSRVLEATTRHNLRLPGGLTGDYYIRRDYDNLARADLVQRAFKLAGGF